MLVAQQLGRSNAGGNLAIPQPLGVLLYDGAAIIKQQGILLVTRVGAGIYDVTTAFQQRAAGGGLGVLVPDLIVTCAFYGSYNGLNGFGGMEYNRLSNNSCRITTWRQDTGALDDALFCITWSTLPSQEP